MKKKIMVLALATLSVLALAACTEEPFTCDLCGEEKTGKKYESSEELNMVICEDCYGVMNEVMNSID